MGLSKYSKDCFKISIFFVSLFGAHLISSQHEKPNMLIPKQSSSFNVNDNIFKYINWGQKRLYSSIFWIATILESDHDHYKGKDLNSWMYIRFLTVSNLEPKFLPTYNFGGPYLSIIKDDLEGASIIYDKGLRMYPDDVDLLNNAAFHYQFEKVDHDKSYELYKKISTFPGTKLRNISPLARLESDKGNLKSAFALLENLYSQQEDKNSILSKKIFSFLYAIKAEEDLNCLNAIKIKCDDKDLLGDTYVLQNDGKYRARLKWTPYKTKAISK